MADISGAVSAFSTNTFSLSRSSIAAEEEEKTLLERLREEIRAEEQATGQRAGVTAPTTVNVTTLEDLRNALAPQQETAARRGFQPEDLEDRVTLSAEAQEILAQNAQATNETVQSQARISETVTDVRVLNNEELEADNDEATQNAVAADNEEDATDQANAEAAVGAEFFANLNSIQASNEQQSADSAAVAEDSEQDSEDTQQAVAAEEENSSEEATAATDAENEAVTVERLDTAANNNIETNQVTENEDDTSVVSGSQDSLNNPNQPQAQRVLGQIIDQFA